MPDPSCHACGGPIAIGEPVTLYHPPCDTMYADALRNARADVTHTMAELARVSAGRDALAAEVTALTRDLLDAVQHLDAAIESARVAATVATRWRDSVRRIHLIADTGSTWADRGRVEVRSIARTLLDG